MSSSSTSFCRRFIETDVHNNSSRKAPSKGNNNNNDNNNNSNNNNNDNDNETITITTTTTITITIMIMIIIRTSFKSQFTLAEHECSTNCRDCKPKKSNQIDKSNKSNNSNLYQIKCWFLRRGENWSSRRKTSRSRVEKQQTQPTYDAGSGNQTRDTLVEGERSHHCANPAPLSLVESNLEK